jgi:hypothetical protein
VSAAEIAFRYVYAGEQGALPQALADLAKDEREKLLDEARAQVTAAKAEDQDTSTAGAAVDEDEDEDGDLDVDEDEDVAQEADTSGA